MLGSRLIGTISQIDLQSLYAQMFERGLSARTIEYTNAVLRIRIPPGRTLEDARGGSLCRSRSATSEAQGDGGCLSVEECRRFLDVAAKSEWFPVLALALTTGMRPSEYLALKWTDIDWQRGTASVSRTIQISGAEWTFDDTKRKRSRREVKLQNFVLKALQGLKQAHESKRKEASFLHSELIFVSASDLPLKQRVVKREFRRLLAAAGIRPIRLYDLRHTAATLGIAAGVSVKVISDQLGHASISFTLERYSHVLPSIQDELRQKSRATPDGIDERNWARAENPAPSSSSQTLLIMDSDRLWRFSVSIFEEGGRLGLKCLLLSYFRVGDNLSKSISLGLLWRSGNDLLRRLNELTHRRCRSYHQSTIRIHAVAT